MKKQNNSGILKLILDVLWGLRAYEKENPGLNFAEKNRIRLNTIYDFEKKS